MRLYGPVDSVLSSPWPLCSQEEVCWWEVMEDGRQAGRNGSMQTLGGKSFSVSLNPTWKQTVCAEFVVLKVWRVDDDDDDDERHWQHISIKLLCFGLLLFCCCFKVLVFSFFNIVPNILHTYSLKIPIHSIPFAVKMSNKRNEHKVCYFPVKYHFLLSMPLVEKHSVFSTMFVRYIS